MTRPNVVQLDPDRRARRQARSRDQRNLEAAHHTDTQTLDADLIARAHAAAAETMADGLPATSLGEPGNAHGDHSDPTLSAVLQRQHTRQTLDELTKRLENHAAEAVRINRLCNQLISATVTPAQADPAGAGHCQRCNTWVTGSTTDRVKSGYCSACYQAWRRAGNPDRTQFNATHTDPA